MIEETYGSSTDLIQLLQRFCLNDGIHASSIPCLKFVRVSHPTEPIHQLHKPALCIVAQGKKVLSCSDQLYHYDANHYLVISVDLPVSGEVIEASKEEPYLCLQLDFDPDQILTILNETQLTWAGNTNDSYHALYISQMAPTLLDAVIRLVRLHDTPEDIPVLAPFFIREILYRVLQGDQAQALRQIAVAGGPTDNITQAIHRIKDTFSTALSVTDLASSVNMSESSFYQHFKQITGFSPLQYQKQIRLQEARRLMLSSSLNAADASFEVGYESPSQFSREYSRKFGMSPIRDIKRMKELH